MSRRDTIIIAVLINAGLLLILFATAITSSSDEETPAPTSTVQIAAAEEFSPLPKESLPTVPGDEVDQVLSQWNAKPATSDANRLHEALQNSSSAAPINLSYQSDASANEKRPVDTPPVKPQPTNDTGSYKIVIVKKGDILDRIAKTNGTTTEEIIALNELPSSQLKIGQSLKVPVKKTTASENKPTSIKKEVSANTSSQPQYYVVKSGDNPWLIAKKNQMALDELLKLNDLDEGKARRLKPGDKIRIK
jgi:LysM repeat protein